MTANRVYSVLLFLVVCSVAIPRRAFAYVDPGAGTYAFQVILALVLGGIASGRARLAEMLRRVRRFVLRGR